MHTQPKKNNNHDNLTTLGELLKTSTELTSNQENFENTIETDINVMDARTRNDNSTRDSQYRSRIALIFTLSFVTLMSIIIIGTPIYNALVDKERSIDQGSLLEAFNSIFGTILGFVLGYYFKDRGEGDKK